MNRTNLLIGGGLLLILFSLTSNEFEWIPSWVKFLAGSAMIITGIGIKRNEKTK